MNEKYKGRNFAEYMTDTDLHRKDHVGEMVRRYPLLKKDSAMLYQLLLCNNDLSKEERDTFSQLLIEARQIEQEKMRQLWESFSKVPEEGKEEETQNDMSIYIEEGVDQYGKHIHRHEEDHPVV